MVEKADLLLDGRLRLRQPAKGHRAGTDAMLLAASLPEAAGLLVDIGAGVGTVGLALALRHPALRVMLVEFSSDAAGFAQENVALNGVGDRVAVCEADVLMPRARRIAGLLDGKADFVVSNPPFFDRGTVRASANSARAAAHVLEPGDLARWIAACLALLRPGGVFAMIHRPASLTEILAACDGRMGGVSVLPVYPRAGEAAMRIIIKGRKGSRAAPQIAPGLVLHSADGVFTAEAEGLHRGLGWLRDP